MKKEIASRQHLETLSTTDLITLADDYGIGIPENLNRNFIIGEILEAIEELIGGKEETIVIEESSEKSKEENYDELPGSYNNTCIDTILRNPAWTFVFWDIKESDKAWIESDSSVKTPFLHVSFYEYADDEKPVDSFDIEVTMKEREQYVMIPAGKKFYKIDLAISFKGKQSEVLASTRIVEIPTESEKIQNAQPGKKFDTSKLVELSGIKHILHDHFLNHRQSFKS